jgi:hypothetical protein
VGVDAIRDALTAKNLVGTRGRCDQNAAPRYQEPLGLARHVKQACIVALLHTEVSMLAAVLLWQSVGGPGRQKQAWLAVVVVVLLLLLLSVHMQTPRATGNRSPSLPLRHMRSCWPAWMIDR